MYPLLYEASIAMRTNAKDAALHRYVRNEFPGGSLAWFYRSVPDEALRFRPRIRRRIRRWIDARLGRPVASNSERAEPA